MNKIEIYNSDRVGFFMDLKEDDKWVHWTLVRIKIIDGEEHIIQVATLLSFNKKDGMFFTQPAAKTVLDQESIPKEIFNSFRYHKDGSVLCR